MKLVRFRRGFLHFYRSLKSTWETGCISKEFSFFVPRFNIDYNGWHVEGDFFEWDYSILDQSGQQIAEVSKQLFNWTDTYVIEVQNPNDALGALMLVLAIDAEKCSRK